ncbi:MAG: hypothetical protein JSU81_09865 [Candidatus Coatesbacteria bacterium]|nr:MAG: hypothetical protein JSU81_09865 [Candidatus Coatesbacteria bacterium]
MKRLIAFTAALVVASSAAVEAGVHIVGGGTPNSNNTFPFWGYHPQFRWQTMWFQYEIGEAGPLTRLEWQMWSNPSGGAGGTFTNCKVLLCHTGIRAVGANFRNNYGGNQPVTAFSGTYVLPRSEANEWLTIVAPTNFTFNNRDNLLIEVSWTAGVGNINPFKCRNAGSHPFPGRVYNSSSATAETGNVTADIHRYGRITISGAGVEATSLGRVKSLYR